jgi:hypothetical protein
MNPIRKGLLQLRRHGLLQLQRHHTITGRMADLARLRVRSGIVHAVGELVLHARGGLALHGFRDGGVPLGVRDALAFAVLGAGHASLRSGPDGRVTSGHYLFFWLLEN